MSEREAGTGQSFGAAHVDAATFRAQLDTSFRLAHDGPPISLRLAEVVDGPARGNLEQFSLFFHGPVDLPLPQGTYTFDHDSLGTMAMFIVPIIESTSERLVYQASFSRFVPSRAQ